MLFPILGEGQHHQWDSTFHMWVPYRRLNYLCSQVSSPEREEAASGTAERAETPPPSRAQARGGDQGNQVAGGQAEWAQGSRAGCF